MFNNIDDPKNHINTTNRISDNIGHINLVAGQHEVLQQEQNNIPDTHNQFFYAIVKQINKSNFELNCSDPPHLLECQTRLLVDKRHREDGVLAVTGYLSKIDTAALEDHIAEDEILWCAIVVRFQIKVMQEYLSFCAQHNANRLYLVIDKDYAKELDIFLNLDIGEQPYQKLGSKMVIMTLSMREQAQHIWTSLMEHTKEKITRKLWQEQRRNPEIKNYLKYHSLDNI